MTPNPTSTTKVNWLVYHGPKELGDRKMSSFDSSRVAYQFFKEKERDGQYVDIFKETTTTYVTKIKVPSL